MSGVSTIGSRPARNGSRVDLLEHDRDLARIRRRDDARLGADLWAETFRLERGRWEPEAQEPDATHLGYLIVRGLLGRRVFVPDRGRSLELLGDGDIIRPWQDEGASFSQVTWTVLEPAAIAVLDETFVVRARETPELLETLIERALRRSRRLAVNAAIANTVGVEDRLLLLLWQLTELWGRKAPHGAMLSFRLSHQTLADLVGARRPTVTLALRSLAERGQLERGPAGEWILVGDPP